MNTAYYFVEYLRATRCLRIVGIILAVLLLIGGVFRLSLLNHHSPQAYIVNLENSPTAHVTKTQLPDGSTRTVVDDPQKRTHAIIVQKGRAFRMDVTEPSSEMRAQHDTMSFGSFNMNEDKHGGMSHVTLSYNGSADISWAGLFVASVLMGLLVSTMLAAPLAKENDGHLELAWTKPVSREAYAFAAFGVDIATIVLSQLLCIAVALICILMWTVPTITLGSGGWTLIGLALVIPIAWYACLTAFSASVKRGPGMVIGLGWFAALVVPSVMAATDEIKSPLAQAIHVVFQTLAYLDPIVYFPSSHGHSGFHGNLIPSLGGALLAVAILTVFYIAVAVLQWRRVEA